MCGELLYATFLLEVNGAVYKSYVRLAILFRSEVWCMKETEFGILRMSERYMLRTMCGVQLKDRKRTRDLLLTLGLNDTMDQLAMTVFIGMVMCEGEKWSCLEMGY